MSGCCFWRRRSIFFGGVFRATSNLQQKNTVRCFNTPLVEQGSIVGFANGLAVQARCQWRKYNSPTTFSRFSPDRENR